MYILSFVILAAAALTMTVIVTIFWAVKQRQLHNKMQKLSTEVSMAQREASQARMVKDIFFQNMSHQIRTPLHAINGFAQLLASPDCGFSEADKAEFAAHIKSNTTILTMLFDDILSIVDIECGKFDINLTDVRVNDIVYEAMHTFDHMVSENVKLTFTTAVSDEFTIRSDSRRLQQVVMNYLSNAIKHTERGFIHIDLRLTPDKKELMISVADSGEGVPKDMAEAIFTRFTKLDEYKQGNGLGLSLCDTIADKLNGRCYLDNSYPNPNSGTSHGAKFVFALPVAS